MDSGYEGFEVGSMSISSDSEMMPLVVVAEVREIKISESRGISCPQEM